jgi:phosphoserine phosphatase
MPPHETLSSSALIDRLARDLAALRRASPHPRPALAFDADGTLWTGDVGEDLLAHVRRERRIRPQATQALRDEARRHGLAERDEPHDQVAVLVDALREGRYPEREAYAMMAWVLAGHRSDEIYRIADEVLAARGHEQTQHAETRPILTWAQEESVEVFVVSASPRCIVEQGVRPLGVARHHVLAMSPPFVDGYQAARVDEPLTYAGGKAEALRQKAPDITLLAAFGDSTFDLALMAMSGLGIAVRPKASLIAVAPHLTRLEPVEG